MKKKERKVVEVSHSIVRYVIEHTDIKLLQLVCRGDQRWSIKKKIVSIHINVAMNSIPKICKGASLNFEDNKWREKNCENKKDISVTCTVFFDTPKKITLIENTGAPKWWMQFQHLFIQKYLSYDTFYQSNVKQIPKTFSMFDKGF